MADKSVPTGLALTQLDDTFRADPYPVLNDLREREPRLYWVRDKGGAYRYGHAAMGRALAEFDEKETGHGHS